MANVGGGPSDPNTAAPTVRKRRGRTPKIKQQLFTLLTSTTATAHSFLTQNDAHLLPFQTLTLSTLLSSLPTPLPLPLPFFHRFLSSHSSHDDIAFQPHWPHFFRMSKQSFTDLLSLLSPSLSSLPPSIPAPSALAAALFRLSHAAPYSTVARMFSLDSPAAACVAFYSVCKAVIDNLGNLLEFRQDWERIVVGFGWIGLPNCRGVLGLGRFSGSVLVQALVDSEGRFLDISAGWPCSLSGAEIFNRSKLRLEIKESNDLLGGPLFDLGDGNFVPHYLLGDSCFPLLPWLLTPYGGGENGGLGSAEMKFNVVHNRAMGLVRLAFRRVKLRWRLLARRWKEESEEFLPVVIVMGCLLHNYLIKCNEPVVGEEGVVEVEVVEEEEGMSVFEGALDGTGQRIRDALAQHLSRVSLRR